MDVVLDGVKGSEKQEIRCITHMHHAVDAITLGLAATFLPHDGTAWAVACKRRVKESEKPILARTGIFRFTAHNEPQLVELPSYLKGKSVETVEVKEEEA